MILFLCCYFAHLSTSLWPEGIMYFWTCQIEISLMISEKVPVWQRHTGTILIPLQEGITYIGWRVDQSTFTSGYLV